MNKTADNIFKYNDISPDIPLVDKELDEYDRSGYAERIAGIVKDRSDPESLVIGINGEWGSGKTTLLNFIKNDLKEDETIICLDFNPWYFNNIDQLCMYFFTLISNVLGKKLKSKSQEILDTVDKYVGILSPVSTILSGIPVGPAAEMVSKGAKALYQENSIEDYHKKINNFISDSSSKIVVFIDDIDRLDKSEIYYLLKLLKLTANFNNTYYILAYDKSIIANALKDMYPNSKSDSGYSYLEKIVQIPLELPLIDQLELVKKCYRYINEVLTYNSIELSDRDYQIINNMLLECLSIRLNSPRKCNLLKNSLIMSISLLKKEVNYVDLVLIESLKVLFPNIYNIIKNNPKTFLYPVPDDIVSDLRDIDKEIISKCLNDLTSGENDPVKYLISYLFPKISNYLGTSTRVILEDDIVCVKQKRVCTQEYFFRYFKYTVSSDDVSDISISELFSDMHNKTEEKFINQFNEIVNNQNVPSVLQKMRLRFLDLDLDEESTIKLLKAIAQNGKYYKKNYRKHDDFDAFNLARYFVKHTIVKLNNNSENMDILKSIFQDMNPLPFCISCYDYMLAIPNILSSNDDNKKTITDLVIDKIQEESNNKNFYLEYQEDAFIVFKVWSEHASKNMIEEYLQKTFDENKNNIVKFLQIFPLYSLDLSTSLVQKDTFDIKQYNLLSTIVDPKIIIERVRDLFGDNLANTYTKDKLFETDTQTDEQIARQFAYLYNTKPQNI